jgi:glycosyltransferase involved in cell wall biosynthesis
MAILEAMATGLPCVMTDLGGAREVIAEGVNGYIGRPADPQSLGEAWKRLISRGGTWNRGEIRERVQRLFSFEACVRGYEKLLGGEVEQ